MYKSFCPPGALRQSEPRSIQKAPIAERQLGLLNGKAKLTWSVNAWITYQFYYLRHPVQLSGFTIFLGYFQFVLGLIVHRSLIDSSTWVGFFQSGSDSFGNFFGSYFFKAIL